MISLTRGLHESLLLQISCYVLHSLLPQVGASVLSWCSHSRERLSPPGITTHVPSHHWRVHWCTQDGGLRAWAF